VGAGERLLVGHRDVCTRRQGRAPGDVAVGAGAGFPLPVGLADVRRRRSGRSFGGVEVGAGAGLPLGGEHHVHGRR